MTLLKNVRGDKKAMPLRNYVSSKFSMTCNELCMKQEENRHKRGSWDLDLVTKGMFSVIFRNKI